MELSGAIAERVNALLEAGPYQNAEEVLSDALGRLEADEFVLRNLPALEVLMEQAQEQPGRRIDEAGYEELKQQILRRALRQAF